MYEIELRQVSDRVTKFTATNVATGQVEAFDSDQSRYAAIPVLIGVPLAVAVLQALAQTLATVVIAGAAYVIATEAVRAIQERGSRYQHFAAARQSQG